MTQEEIVHKKKRIDELKVLIQKKKEEYDYNKAMQLALKLTLNGTYGAFANKHFVAYNSNIANAITAHGRDVIQYMLKKIENYFYNEWHLDKKTHDLLGFEYVGFDNISKQYSLYDKMYNNTWRSFSDIDDLLVSRSASKSNLEKIDSPIDISESVQLLYKYDIHDFSDITAIDSNPIWTKEGDSDYVDIVAYNGENPVGIYSDTDSLYLTYEPLMESSGFMDKENAMQFILHVDAVFVKGLFLEYLEKYAKPYKVKNLHDFELETVSKSSLFIAKKNYLNNIVWEDGVHHKDLSYFYPKGIEIVRSSTPEFVRTKIYDVINYIFGNPDDLTMQNILKIVKKLKEEFKWASINNIDSIAMTTSCSNYDLKVLNDTTAVETVNAAHFGVKAAAFHNYLLNKNSEYKTRYSMIKSGKIKYYACIHPDHEVFAYMRSFHPIEIVEKENIKIDIDTQFDKTVLTIVNRFMKPLGLPIINKRLKILESMFNFD